MSDGETSVLVTGGTGYLAAHLIEQLLQRGYTVRTTVRSTTPEKIGFLQQIEHSAERLSFFKADLLGEPECFEQAMDGCSAVFHLASPVLFTYNKDPYAELVEPAVQGTSTVLKACKKQGIKNIVVTSSVGAVYEQPVAGHLYTEADWNTGSTLKKGTYLYSKVQAEKAVWKFAEENPDFKIVTLCPAALIGPQHHPTTVVDSVKSGVLDAFQGAYPAMMALDLPLVDVRDAALAHILAMESTTAKGRYIVCTDVWSHRKLMEFYKSKVSKQAGKKLPKRGLDGKIGTSLVRFLANFQPRGIKEIIHANVGRKLQMDNSKVIMELGLAFRPLEEGLMETYDDLVAKGHLKGDTRNVKVRGGVEKAS